MIWVYLTLRLRGVGGLNFVFVQGREHGKMSPENILRWPQEEGYLKKRYLRALQVFSNPPPPILKVPLAQLPKSNQSHSPLPYFPGLPALTSKYCLLFYKANPSLSGRWHNPTADFSNPRVLEGRVLHQEPFHLSTLTVRARPGTCPSVHSNIRVA